MRVLVAGASGQVALSLVEAARARKVELMALGRPQLDIGDEGSIARAVASVKPDLVINAAAYTTVDLAESEPEAARRINAIAPGWLARCSISQYTSREAKPPSGALSISPLRMKQAGPMWRTQHLPPLASLAARQRA